MLALSGTHTDYLKGTRGQKTPDYVIVINNTPIILEVGGKHKGRQQFKGISIKTKLILSHSDQITPDKCPLFLLGFCDQPNP